MQHYVKCLCFFGMISRWRSMLRPLAKRWKFMLVMFTNRHEDIKEVFGDRFEWEREKDNNLWTEPFVAQVDDVCEDMMEEGDGTWSIDGRKLILYWPRTRSRTTLEKRKGICRRRWRLEKSKVSEKRRRESLYTTPLYAVRKFAFRISAFTTVMGFNMRVIKWPRDDRIFLVEAMRACCWWGSR